MKRQRIDIDEIGAWSNLLLAVYKAARSKRDRHEVQGFFSDLDRHLKQLQEDILLGNAPRGHYTSFRIRDPKPRIIHAACFEDRVLHHAIMNLAGPAFERAMMDDSFACLPNKGSLKAVHRVQHHLRRYPWYAKIDIEHYFPNIHHELLKQDLARLFKGQEFLQLLSRVIDSYHFKPLQGLPIGSLTSQYFANYHLNQIDRFILNLPQVRAYVRYMDDCVWWVNSQQEAKLITQHIIERIELQKGLKVKPDVQINRSTHGMTYCGYRILPGAIRLTTRRKRRFQNKRFHWEWLYLQGLISDLQLQQAMSAIHATVMHADSLTWRRENMKRYPSLIPEYTFSQG